MVSRTGWRAALILAKNGIPKPVLANVVLVLEGSTHWKGIIAFDEFAHRTILMKAPPWEKAPTSFKPRPWTDTDDITAATLIQLGERIFATPAQVAQAVETVSRQHGFNPLLDYLNGCQYDGTARLDTMMSVYFGAKQSAYSAAVARNMMISAAARAFKPGCKADTMLILEGKQGLLKSTAIKALFDPWFTDEIAELGSKDASMQVAGVWCIEVGELDAMSKGEVSRIKAFISRTTDRFRPPYGSRVVERPRCCVFVGSTNMSDYLKDWTGARRFNPLDVGVTGAIDVAGLIRDRDQLWAEAVAAYKVGEAWWFTDKQAEASATAVIEQDQRYQEDAWERPIASYLDSRLHQPPDAPANQVDIHHVFRQALHMDHEERWDQAAMNRIARILARLGWKRVQVRVNVAVQGKTESRRVWKYCRKPTKEELRQDRQQRKNDKGPDPKDCEAAATTIEEMKSGEFAARVDAFVNNVTPLKR